MPRANNPKPTELGKGRVWITESKSTPDTYHATFCSDDGEWFCSCRGFRYFSGNCIHLRTIQNTEPDGGDFQTVM